jgi:hypothetical protein
MIFYYYAHPDPVMANTGYRKHIADEVIDRFVIRVAKEDHPSLKGDYGTGNYLVELIGNLPIRYRDYVNNLLWKDNVTFVKYEDMVTDLKSWTKKVMAAFYFPNAERVIEDLVAKHTSSFNVNKEDILSHKRKITPGNHKHKLRAETIKELNRIFKDILVRLDYVLH